MFCNLQQVERFDVNASQTVYINDNLGYYMQDTVTIFAPYLFKYSGAITFFFSNSFLKFFN